MINGNEYSWEDIQIILPGTIKPIDGVVEISYTTKKDHQNIYGRGDKPVAMGRGKKEFEGTITILQSTLEALQASVLLKGKDITDINAFNITVAYAPEGGIAVADMLRFVRFKEVPKGMKTGDPNMEIAIPLAIGAIDYNV